MTITVILDYPQQIPPSPVIVDDITGGIVIDDTTGGEVTDEG